MNATPSYVELDIVFDKMYHCLRKREFDHFNSFINLIVEKFSLSLTISCHSYVHAYYDNVSHLQTCNFYHIYHTGKTFHFELCPYYFHSQLSSPPG